MGLGGNQLTDGKRVSGWWFQIFFTFPHIWDGLQPPTRFYFWIGNFDWLRRGLTVESTGNGPKLWRISCSETIIVQLRTFLKQQSHTTRSNTFPSISTIIYSLPLLGVYIDMFHYLLLSLLRPISTSMLTSLSKPVCPTLWKVWRSACWDVHCPTICERHLVP